jgi:endonuclease-8
VAFNIQIAEFHTPDSLRRHRSLSRLGPDVLAGEFDAEAASARIAARADLEVGVALLSQSIVAGLGNVFKSEVCFVTGVNPFRSVGSLSPAELDTLMTQARKLMLSNVADGSGDGIVTYTGLRRTTRRSDPSDRLWVYGRRGEPCRRCGTAIASYKQGIEARVTFWCPQCQPRKVE